MAFFYSCAKLNFLVGTKCYVVLLTEDIVCRVFTAGLVSYSESFLMNDYCEISN